MLAGIPLLGDDDVGDLVPMGVAIEALRAAFADEASGAAATMPRTRVVWDGGRLQSLGGHLPSAEAAAVKSWAVTPGGGQPIVLLFSTTDGRLQCIMEGGILGRIRTGAASGLATDLLAVEDASVLALIGTGRQAFCQAAAVAHVRELERIVVCGRHAGRAQALADRLARDLHVETAATTSVAEAAERADVITVITNSTEPVLEAEHVAPGTHVNGAGAIMPAHLELATSVFAMADVVAVDSVEQAAREAGDLAAAIAAGAVRDPVPLSAVLTGEKQRRSTDVTVFKSVGVGLEDVAVAHAAWRAFRRASMTSSKA